MLNLYSLYYLKPFFFQKLWDDLKNLLDSVKEVTDMDIKLKESFYKWGLQYRCIIILGNGQNIHSPNSISVFV